MTSLRRSDLAAFSFPSFSPPHSSSPPVAGPLPTRPRPAGAAAGGPPPSASRGVVTAVGALTVNGIAFDASTAQIRIDDNPGRPESELKVGMVVTVKGSKDDAAGTGRATEIETHHVLRGKVDDKGGSVFRVGGHEVEVEHATEFEDRLNRLGSVSVGERVRVHGHATATGHFRATRVEKETGSSEDFEVKGFVSDLDRTAGKFTLKVTPDAASSYAVTLGAGASIPAGVVNGSYVEVRAAAAPAAGALTATAVQLEDAKLGGPQAEVEVEGIVTSGSSVQFVVEGQVVAPSATTRWENGVPADLVPGVKVEAEGRLDASNVLQATKVSFRASVRLQGPVSGITSTSAREGSFQLLGLTVRTDAWTEWKSSGGGASLDLTTIGAGPVENPRRSRVGRRDRGDPRRVHERRPARPAGTGLREGRSGRAAHHPGDHRADGRWHRVPRLLRRCDRRGRILRPRRRAEDRGQGTQPRPTLRRHRSGRAGSRSRGAGRGQGLRPRGVSPGASIQGHACAPAACSGSCRAAPPP